MTTKEPPIPRTQRCDCGCGAFVRSAPRGRPRQYLDWNHRVWHHRNPSTPYPGRTRQRDE